MALFKSGNPTVSEKSFEKSLVINTGEVMTVRGTMNKFGFLFLMVMATAFYTWNAFFGGQDVMGYMLTGAFGGLIVALVIVFKQQWAAYLAPLYALLEGLFVGAVSAYYSARFAESAPYIIIQAVLLTFGTAVSMFFLYQFRVIRATETFRSVIFTATMGIAIFYLISWVLRMFGITIPFIHEGSTFGIIFSLVVVTIAALNLILDFDMIERGSEMGAPKYMEWYGAFGLLVTIVWLYLEILRLLGKLNSRD
ncbi:Bax inhibitor-1/YccA family protein [Pollutibacter soli]|uniref:Bax inhibitor-1/YccA family protein n=1 Tax=Pollutibacter soli TaxID=3034157 RepID=UPI0030137FBA